MPLTLTRQLYKNFPGMFADGVNEHVRKRTESYKNSNTVASEEQEVSDMSHREELRPYPPSSPPRPPQETSTTPQLNSTGNKSEKTNQEVLRPYPPSSSTRPPQEISPTPPLNSTGHKSENPSQEVLRPYPPTYSPQPPQETSPTPPPLNSILSNSKKTRQVPPSTLNSTGNNSKTKLENPSQGPSTKPSRKPSSRGLKLDLSKRRESPSPRGASKRESPSPQTQGSFTSAFRAIRPRQSPRTTVSLDAVDLWEDEEEEEFSDGSEFDEINGVVINPSKTFDFSELNRSRSPVACKRNKLDWKKPTVAENLKLSLRKLDSEVQAASAKGSGRVSPGRVSPGRVSPGRVSPGRRKSPRELRAWKPRPRIAGRHKNVFLDPEPEPSRTEPALHTARNTLTNSLAKSIDGRLPLVQESSEIRKDLKKEPTVPNGKMLNKRLSLLRSKTDFSLHRLKEEVEMVSDSADETDSLNSTGEKRHVKFNSLVTVREGEINSVDALRNSNNSAQMFKKQYLVPQGWREELPDLSGRSLHA